MDKPRLGQKVPMGVTGPELLAELCRRDGRKRDMEEQLKGLTRTFHSAFITQVRGRQWKRRVWFEQTRVLAAEQGWGEVEIG